MAESEIDVSSSEMNLRDESMELENLRLAALLKIERAKNSLLEARINREEAEDAVDFLQTNFSAAINILDPYAEYKYAHEHASHLQSFNYGHSKAALNDSKKPNRRAYVGNTSTNFDDGILREIRGHGDFNITSSASYETNLSVDDDQQTSIPNPFLLDTILGQLRRYLNHNGLATGRLVCTLWNQTLSSEFMNRTKITFDCSSFVTEEIEKWSGKLFSAYPISEFDLPEKLAIGLPSTMVLTMKPRIHHRGTQTLLKWLNIYGKKISDLQIRLAGEWNYGECPQELLWQLITSCTNLETLRIPFPTIQSTLNQNLTKLFPKITTLEIGFGGFCRRRLNFLNSIKILLRTTSNLKILRLNLVSQITETDLLEYLDICRNVGFLEDLVELDLRKTILNTAVLETLATLQFKCLKRLTLESYILLLNPPASTAFNTLLSKVSFSLEELRIRLTINIDPEPEEEDDDDEEPPDQTSLTISSIPEMECLKKLEFHSDITPEQESIEFLQRFPKLEVLIITEKGNGDVINRLFPDNLQFRHTLRVLKIPELQIQSFTLQVIIRCFPLLEVLSIRLPSCQQLFSPTAMHSGMLTLSNLPKLSELIFQCTGMNENDFNKSVSIMFTDDEMNFSALKRFTFDCESQRILLKEETVLGSFKNAYALEYLELKNFLINNSEKDVILESLSKINLVRFVNCLLVNPFGQKNKKPCVPYHEEIISIGQTRSQIQKEDTIWEVETGSSTETKF